jgi:hypothetical protein
MSFEEFEELQDDMESELEKVGNLERLKVIRNGEEKLGGKRIYLSCS